jgi:hypothetical protein
MVPAMERRSRLIMLYQAHNAFFDESGTHDGSDIITVGGLISSYDGWSRWEIEHQRILKAFGINVFHFSKFMARKGEFNNDWSDEKRNEFMERLCTTVSDNIVVGLATSVFREDYERYVPDWLRRQVRHPYYFGLFTCFWQIVTMPQVTKRVTLPKPVEFLFDRKRHYEGFASSIFYSIKDQFEKLEWSHPIGDMGFGAKDKDIPLQAADLLVGVVSRNRVRNWMKTSSLTLRDADMDKAILALGKSGRLLLSNASAPELEKFVACFPVGTGQSG